MLHQWALHIHRIPGRLRSASLHMAIFETPVQAREYGLEFQTAMRMP